MVDGLGVGDVGDVVLRDRGHLSQDGVVIAVIGMDMSEKQIVSGPDLFSRGFMGEDYGEDLMEQGKEVLLAKMQDFIESDALDVLDTIRAAVRKALAKLIYDRMHRRPVIVPIVMEV
jgi:ribonuclease J